MGISESYSNYRMMSKISLGVTFAVFIAEMAGWLFTGYRKWFSENPESLKVISKISKVIRTEILPSLFLFALCIYTMSFELGATILFFLAIAGFGVMMFGELKGPEGKMLQDIGRAVGLGSTAIMLIVMMAKMSYVTSS